jgi:hypothetical protein
MKKILKLFGWMLLITIIVLQFFQPTMNEGAAVDSQRIMDVYPASEETKSILATSCYDCHSNTTKPMWYMHVQPVGMWIMHHVEEGKEELNFDEFGTYSLRRQYHKLEEIGEVLSEDEMPLYSYTIMHGDATLSDAQRKTLTDWAASIMDTLEARYPLDSLVRKN